MLNITRDTSKSAKILKQLVEMWRKTPRHIDGSILGSMTTYPHPLAVYAYTLFIHVNASDPVIFPVIEKFEEEIAEKLRIFFGEFSSLYITSGGTESNFDALIAARRTYPSRENTVVAPDTVHISIDKACSIMNCRIAKIPVENKPVDPNTLEEYVKKYKPFAIVVTAGTTEAGLVDPIKEAARIAYETETYLHVDAAYGGLLIPFLYKHGFLEENLYFYEGVSSISVDFHKNGLSPIPSSTLLFTDKKYLEAICFEASYTLSGKTCGLLGTRPGGSVASIWAVLEYMGYEGFEEQALELMRKAGILYEELSTLKDLIVYKPVLPIVVFKHKNISSKELLSMLLDRGYYVYRSPSLDALRVVVMPHLTREHILRFARSLREIIEGGTSRSL